MVKYSIARYELSCLNPTEKLIKHISTISHIKINKLSRYAPREIKKKLGTTKPADGHNSGPLLLLRPQGSFAMTLWMGGQCLGGCAGRSHAGRSHAGRSHAGRSHAGRSHAAAVQRIVELFGPASHRHHARQRINKYYSLSFVFIRYHSLLFKLI
jgi:hypothetical protein